MAGLPVRLRGLLTAAVLGPALALSLTASAAAQPPAFDAWLESVKRDAAAAGISEPTIEAALAGVRPIERVLELDRRQPEFTSTFWAYLDRSVTPARIERGRRLLTQHRDLLERVRGEYNVQPRYLVAFWGLESDFGRYTGNFSVIGALATLAYDARRGAFFRAQLLEALRILGGRERATCSYHSSVP